MISSWFAIPVPIPPIQLKSLLMSALRVNIRSLWLFPPPPPWRKFYVHVCSPVDFPPTNWIIAVIIVLHDGFNLCSQKKLSLIFYWKRGLKKLIILLRVALNLPNPIPNLEHPNNGKISLARGMSLFRILLWLVLTNSTRQIRTKTVYFAAYH